jgi:D-alanyl-D-alanine carboxypeptidase
MTHSRLRIASALAFSMSAMLLGTTLSRVGAQESTARPSVVACNEQQPDATLVRGNWVVKARMSREEQQRRRHVAEDAIRIRTERYGYFDGFGRSEWNPHPPLFYARGVSIFGLRTRLHERIIPAVQCAERAIAEQCVDSPYRPERLSGIRDRNTYHNGEVSNHVYGIALDIDPTRNSCCGCVAPWPDHPLCRLETDDIFQRMAMPECWVRQFQRFGFYWLGDDELRDTMHFEFLADPDRIVAQP